MIVQGTPSANSTNCPRKLLWRQ